MTDREILYWTKERVRQVGTRICDKLRQIAAALALDLIAA